MYNAPGLSFFCSRELRTRRTIASFVVRLCLFPRNRSNKIVVIYKTGFGEGFCLCIEYSRMYARVKIFWFEFNFEEFD